MWIAVSELNSSEVLINGINVGNMTQPWSLLQFCWPSSSLLCCQQPPRLLPSQAGPCSRGEVQETWQAFPTLLATGTHSYRKSFLESDHFFMFNDCPIEFYGTLEEFRPSYSCTIFVWFSFTHCYFKIPLFLGERLCVHLTEIWFIDNFSVSWPLLLIVKIKKNTSPQTTRRMFCAFVYLILDWSHK